jgi:hypothetical protein
MHKKIIACPFPYLTMFEKKNYRFKNQILPVKILENKKISVQKFFDFDKNKFKNLPILTKTTEPL